MLWKKANYTGKDNIESDFSFIEKLLMLLKLINVTNKKRRKNAANKKFNFIKIK